jgi:hypothetical protein
VVAAQAMLLLHQVLQSVCPDHGVPSLSVDDVFPPEGNIKEAICRHKTFL